MTYRKIIAFIFLGVECANAQPISRDVSYSVRNQRVSSTAIVQDILYVGAGGAKVPAYLVGPKQSGISPAVLFLHPASGDRTTFLAEAEALAAKGFISLLPDAPFKRPAPWGIEGGMSNPDKEARSLRQMLGDLNVGIDLLRSLPRVDSSRIFYVGLNYGASLGGALAGTETRIKGYVLRAGMPSMSTFWSQSLHPVAVKARAGMSSQQTQSFVSKTRRFDAVPSISIKSSAPILFQFGANDDWIPLSVAKSFFDSAGHPKTIKLYPTDHRMNSRDVVVDSSGWIAQLALKASQDPLEYSSTQRQPAYKCTKCGDLCCIGY